MIVLPTYFSSMYTSLQASDTAGLNIDQRGLVTDLDAEVCMRETLGALIHLMQEIDEPTARGRDFVVRCRQVVMFLREHGIDFFDGADFSRWNNTAWIGALAHLRTFGHQIDAGMISSERPALAYIGKPFVEDDIAESAGSSPDILPFLQSEFPEYDFELHTLDTRTRIAKISDYLRITAHPLLKSAHPHYIHFIRHTLVPRAEQIMSSSVAAEGNEMLKKWLKICASKGHPDVNAHKDVFFRQLVGLHTDRERLFEAVRFTDSHMVNERVMNPNVRARDVDAVVVHITSALRGAWTHKHQVGQELTGAHPAKIQL